MEVKARHLQDSKDVKARYGKASAHLLYTSLSTVLRGMVIELIDFPAESHI